MTRIFMTMLAGALLAIGCSKSPTSGTADSAPSGELVERAKAEAMKEFCLSWTNSGSVWESMIPKKKSAIQLTNMIVRVEAVELSDKQRAKGFTWGAEVFFAGSAARTHTDKGGWSDWKPTIPMRYPVFMSNGVCVVENSFRKTFILPSASQ